MAKTKKKQKQSISPRAKYLMKVREDTFCKTFDAVQLLNLTVLYYNFNYSKEEIIRLGNKYIENDTNLNDMVWCYTTRDKIEKILDRNLETVIREFPYRARIQMMGGIPKGNMEVVNMANENSSQAIYSMFILVVNTMIQEKNWGKTEIELWWSNIKSNSENYKEGMTNEFVANYLKDYLDLTITNVNEKPVTSNY